MGCRGDPGPARDLDGRERVLLGLPLDPNRASAEDLAAVPGLSPVLAAAIVAYRPENGPFASVDDLEDVSGIGPATLEEIRDQITV